MVGDSELHLQRSLDASYETVLEVLRAGHKSGCRALPRRAKLRFRHGGRGIRSTSTAIRYW